MNSSKNSLQQIMQVHSQENTMPYSNGDFATEAIEKLEVHLNAEGTYVPGIVTKRRGMQPLALKHNDAPGMVLALGVALVKLSQLNEGNIVVPANLPISLFFQCTRPHPAFTLYEGLHRSRDQHSLIRVFGPSLIIRNYLTVLRQRVSGEKRGATVDWCARNEVQIRILRESKSPVKSTKELETIVSNLLH